MTRRLRRWLGVAAVACLAGQGGCGWRAVHAPAGGAAAAHLEEVDVAIIPERQGQLLRQALQARLQRGGDGQSARYVLRADYSVQREGIAITPDSSVTRIRLIATSGFVLRSRGERARTCVSGTAREVDGFDVENQQFFASDLEAETAERRLAEAMANQIATRLSVAAGVAGGFGCEVR